MCTNIAKCQVIWLEKKKRKGIKTFVYIGKHDWRNTYSRKATKCEHHNCMFLASINLWIVISLKEAYHFGYRTGKKLVNCSLLHLENQTSNNKDTLHMN